MSATSFPGYPGRPADEAVGADGRLRDGYAVLGPVLDRWSGAGLPVAAARLAAEHRARGVAVGTWSDGRQETHPLHLDPIPRVLPAAEWARLARGVEQRHRALNAFLADAYRAAGRRRGDPDRSAEIVRAGRLPEWAVAHSPGRDPQAVGLAWSGQPRATVAATDVVRTAAGEWSVVSDDLRVPCGLGYALANRESARAALPDLFAGEAPVEPALAVPVLRDALRSAAPPAVDGPARLAVLGAGEGDADRFEQRLLAEALQAPLVGPGDVWPRMDGGVEVAVDGVRHPVDVFYRRLGDATMAAYRTPIGQPLASVLAEAVRAGRLGLANVPGNGVADDASTFAWVPQMIRFYLGEEPLLPAVRTWVLADPAQWAEVRDRLHELVLIPVAGYGGGTPVAGPTCSAAELAELQAEVAAAPHRFVAREPVPSSTVPTLIGGVPAPRHVDLRVFSVAGSTTRALPAPLTRVALAEGSSATGTGIAGGTKDTWLLP